MKKIILSALLAGLAFQLQAQQAPNIATDKTPGTDCENTATDKFIGAQNRSVTPCEAELDKQVRSAFRQAFDKLISGWTANGWVLSPNSNIEIKPIENIARGSEQFFFNPWLADLGSFYLELNMDASSAPYRKLYDEYNAVMEEWKSKPGADTYKKVTEFHYRMKNATIIRIYTFVNNPQNGITIFKGGYKPLNVSGAAYSVFAANVQALSGGDIENSSDACLILFGKPKLQVSNPGDGVQSITSGNIFPLKTSRLTIQQVALRIECNSQLLEKVLKDTNLSLLRGLIKKLMAANDRNSRLAGAFPGSVNDRIFAAF